MQMKKMIGVILTLVMILLLASCSNNSNGNDRTNQSENIGTSINGNDVSTNKGDDLEVEQEYTGKIFLYGEEHGVEKIIDKEFELWHEYYHQQGMRHLFIESPYYTAEFLNLWMSSDNNDILDELFVDWMGSPKHNPKYKDFFEKIKKECPETIFHGTDVGHQYATIGERYLEYLRENNLADSEQYQIAKEVTKQGELFSGNNSSAYRENMMVENFNRELKKLSTESVMGIYGAMHTGLKGMDYSDSVPSMANQLKEFYGDNINSEDLSSMAYESIITLGNKDYETEYFGNFPVTGSKDILSMKYYNLKDAYEDFMDKPTMFSIPQNMYPMPLEAGLVYVIDITKKDGSVERIFSRSAKNMSGDTIITFAFSLDELNKLEDPIKNETINVKGKDYEAFYYGIRDVQGIMGVQSMEFWRLENAYLDFKENTKDSSIIPNTSYPFFIETEQVYIIDLKMIDGSVKRGYFRTDGEIWGNMLITEGFVVEE